MIPPPAADGFSSMCSRLWARYVLCLPFDHMTPIHLSLFSVWSTSPCTFPHLPPHSGLVSHIDQPSSSFTSFTLSPTLNFILASFLLLVLPGPACRSRLPIYRCRGGLSAGPGKKIISLRNQANLTGFGHWRYLWDGRSAKSQSRRLIMQHFAAISFSSLLLRKDCLGLSVRS